MPKGTRGASSTRTSAFGLYNKPITVLRTAVRDLLAEVRHHRCNAEKSAHGLMPIKRLRNRLLTAMALNTACQPAQVEVEYISTKHGQKTKKKKLDVNPIWLVAPKGAFYKARRVCSLVTDVVTVGGSPSLAHDLERLAIHIWRMSKRHFDGLCRRIRSKIAKSVRGTELIRKSPETVKRFEALMTNPFWKQKVVSRCSRHRTCPHKKGYAAMRLSTKVEIVTESHKCKRCTREARASIGLLQTALQRR